MGRTLVTVISLLGLMGSYVSVISATPIEQSAGTRLMKARSLKCSFGPGTHADWSGDEVKVHTSRYDVTIHFDSIDLKSQTARMISNAGSADIVVFPTPSGVTFIEKMLSGNISITTVFTRYKKGETSFIAVTSRHMNLMSNPLPSQYHGTCKVWE